MIEHTHTYARTYTHTDRVEKSFKMIIDRIWFQTSFFLLNVKKVECSTRVMPLTSTSTSLTMLFENRRNLCAALNVVEMRQSRTKSIYANDMLFVDIYTTWKEKPAHSEAKHKHKHERFEEWIGTEHRAPRALTHTKRIIHTYEFNQFLWMNEWMSRVCAVAVAEKLLQLLSFLLLLLFSLSHSNIANCNSMKSIQLKFYSVTAAMAFTQSTCI